MSDRRISTDTLTDIADAIRSKTGGSALITPQNMATEIASISSGGSLPSGINAIATGSFTLEEDTTGYTIQHNLDGYVRMLCVYINGFIWGYKDQNLGKTIFVTAGSFLQEDVRAITIAQKKIATGGNISNTIVAYVDHSMTRNAFTLSNITLPATIKLGNSSSTEEVPTPWRWIAIK